VPFLFTTIYTTHNIKINKDLLYENILINFFSIFIMSATILQLIALGLFTTLMSNQLGLVKKNFIIKLLIIFDLKKILTTLFISLALFAYLIFKIFQGEISNIYYIFYTFMFGVFTIQSIFSCLFISLLELNKLNK